MRIHPGKALIPLLFCTGYWVMGQEQVESGILPSIFRTEDPISLTISTNMVNLIGNRKPQDEYQLAWIIYETKGTTDTIETRIRARGTFRKDTMNCDFPPLRINFKKKDIRNTIFGPQDEFRIVTHCRTGDKQFVNYVLREYYVYKIYKVLNPMCLGTRLALITYIDDSGTMKPLTRYGFILEDEDEFATRLNMEEIKTHMTFNQIEERNGLILSLFQFMIGNTDWIVQFSKNLIFLKKNESIYCVPYDFDYCGIVNTDYRNAMGFTTLTQPEREFKGKCYTRDQLKTAIKFFRKSKHKIMHEILAAKQLDHESVIYMYNYISQFYIILNSSSECKKYFYVNCGG